MNDQDGAARPHDPDRYGPDYLPPAPAPWLDRPVPPVPPAPETPVAAGAITRTPRRRRSLRVVGALTAAALVLAGGGVVLGRTLLAPPGRPAAVASGNAGSSSGSTGSTGAPGNSGTTPGGGQGALGGGQGMFGGGLRQLPGGPGKSTATTAAGRQASATITPSLVDITTTIDFGQAQAAGTGIVLTSNGLVLTNHHVVAGATGISAVDLGNGQTYRATVVGYDRTHDVAVMQLENASGLQVATLDTAGVQVGDGVVGVGNAGGLGGAPSASEGQVTALERSITVSSEDGGNAEHLTGLIETDAAIRPGDSGGPLVDLQGEVVGVDTAASSANTTGRGQPEGYAIPIADAMAIADQITSGQASGAIHIGQTAFLGVTLLPGGSSTLEGAVVSGVVPGSAAEQLGLRPGDVITDVNGNPVDAASLAKDIGRTAVGDQVTLTWTDQYGQQQSGTVSLGAGPVG